MHRQARQCFSMLLTVALMGVNLITPSVSYAAESQPGRAAEENAVLEESNALNTNDENEKTEENEMIVEPEILNPEAKEEEELLASDLEAPETVEEQWNEENANAPPEAVQVEEPYGNYLYGDSACSGNFIAGYDEEGNEIPEMYTEDVGRIIQMAEEGMNLEHFFTGTILSGFTLDELYLMQEEGYTFDGLTLDYYYGREIPEWAFAAFARGDSDAYSFYDLDTREAGDGTVSWPDSLKANGVSDMTANPLGIIPSLGNTKSHGTVKKLSALGDGINYSAFCALYGGSFSRAYNYHQIDYSQVTAPSGRSLTESQYKMIQTLINVFVKTTDQTDGDYAAVQFLIWYFINHDVPSWIDYDSVWADGIEEAASVLYPGNEAFIYASVCAVCNYYNFILDGTITMSDFSAISSDDRYPGEEAVIQFWATDASNSQWIITWQVGNSPASGELLAIPYIDNFYLEKEAVAKYNVDITKESIITNEFLEDVSFDVVESEAEGFDLTYDIYMGDYAEYGSDYPGATTEAGNFGQMKTVSDPVPYMDSDAEPSGGQHRTVITTDEQGHASATFVHRHTFREFYSVCRLVPEGEIDFAAYISTWERVLEKAESLGDGEALAISYMGEMKELTKEEIEDIYEKQQVVYTQTQAAAQATIDDGYDNYMARTYTYTVTELDRYTRNASADSNGKVLPEIFLPKEGYRKNVQDATTMEPYVEIVKNGGVMIVGGKNDADENTKELNATNEPWYNQIFINKTDLETGSPILHDTDFQIYEYYQWQATVTAKEQRIYPSLLLNRMLTEYGSSLRLNSLTAAELVITDENGNEALRHDVDVEKMTGNMENPYAYHLSFMPTTAGTYHVCLNITMDSAANLTDLSMLAYEKADVEELGSCICEIACLEDCPVCARNPEYCRRKDGEVYTAFRLSGFLKHQEEISGASVREDGAVVYIAENGASIVYAADENGIYQYTYTAAEGTVEVFDPKTNRARIFYDDGQGYFTYQCMEDTGITLFSLDGTVFKGEDSARTYARAKLEEDGSIKLYYYIGNGLPDGVYQSVSELAISANQLICSDRNKDVGTDINDYTTWGQDNYEIVRVTADIAKEMGWSDSVIGMYTVHRLFPTDQYAGTTFSEAKDEATGETFGYHKYGTLYYTQANLGHFCIVEETAPADGKKNGYLGNYGDRNYTKLSEESGEKNLDGEPYATDDEMSTEKLVHYLHLCEDTNQYATYMLTDGYEDYDSVYYLNYVETLDDPGKTPTGDGYDA